jgi:hypothetical protein
MIDSGLAVGAEPLSEGAIDLLASARGTRFGPLLADPKWR